MVISGSKVLVLHLSDVHAHLDSPQVRERFNALPSAINQLGPGVAKCFVVISGDVTSEGTPREYSLVLDMLRGLREQVESAEKVPSVLKKGGLRGMF